MVDFFNFKIIGLIIGGLGVLALLGDRSWDNHFHWAFYTGLIILGLICVGIEEYIEYKYKKNE